MVENIESLLLTSESVNKKTFKFLDPGSGKMLGVHADITPQIARIDAKQGSDKIANALSPVNSSTPSGSCQVFMIDYFMFIAEFGKCGCV
jgi:hypothetical protein